MEISKMLLIELQEGDSNKGGVSYAGERLVDFLLETDHLHLIDEEGGFDEINSLLSECGIKPIDFSEEFGLNSLESKLIQEKTFGVKLYYSDYSAQKDSDATPVFTEKELVSVANELLINSSEDDVESFTSVEDAINYLEEVAEWNPIKEYSQYFKQSELEEVK
jgi:hypothetical protein